MKTKFRNALSEKCKDMGLTDKLLDELTELGCVGLKDDATDEDITAKVDSIVPFAKAMQGEITRKTKPSSKSSKQQSKKEGNEDDDEGEDGKDVPEWFKPFQQQMTSLQAENDKLKAEKAKSERTADIAAKAKKLRIPEYLMKRVTFADDADIDKELADYKQELVNHNLMPKEAQHETGSEDEQMRESAKAWASSLPSK
jgi:hypothetical protein